MNFFFSILVLGLFLNTSTFADDIKKFQIERIRIGDSALDFFSEAQLEDNEMDWFNYSYKEYSTSLLPGKGIYDWFKISYKSDDDNFRIEGLVGILVKENYDNKECNKQLDTVALDVSGLFKNTKQGRKKLYKIVYNPRKIFHSPDSSGKSTVTSISFNLQGEGKIILACYDMDKATNQIDSPIKDINQFDTFRIDIRSRALVYYLEKA
jgi:hypothetical protein